MAEIDPIKALSLASQFRTPISENRALRDLQTKGALTNLENRSLEARTRQQGINTLRNTALTQNISMPESGILGQLGQGQLEEGRLADLFGKHATGTSLLRRAGMVPQLPEGGALPSEMPQQRYKLGDFPQSAAEKVKAMGELTIKEVEESHGFNEAGDYVKMIKTKGAKVTGKSTDSARGARILKDAQAQFPGDDVKLWRDPSGDIYVKNFTQLLPDGSPRTFKAE
jgi:hypothetical protein